MCGTTCVVGQLQPGLGQFDQQGFTGGNIFLWIHMTGIIQHFAVQATSNIVINDYAHTCVHREDERPINVNK